MGSFVEFQIDGLKLESLNAREHHMAKARRMTAQRDCARAHTLASRARPMLPIVVTITRVGAKLLDSDNLVGSAKPVRDGIAKAYGIDDASPEVTWRVQQECRRKTKGRPQYYGVRVRVEAASECTTRA